MTPSPPRRRPPATASPPLLAKRAPRPLRYTPRLVDPVACGATAIAVFTIIMFKISALMIAAGLSVESAAIAAHGSTSAKAWLGAGADLRTTIPLNDWKFQQVRCLSKSYLLHPWHHPTATPPNKLHRRRPPRSRTAPRTPFRSTSRISSALALGNSERLCLCDS